MSDEPMLPKMSAKNGPKHPFALKEPKPTRARLVGLLDPLGRKRYAEVERFLATVNGATSGLNFFENGWGWAVRYMLGPRELLCTLHLLPNQFESTVGVGAEFEALGDGGTLPPEVRRRLARVRPSGGVRWLRVPIRSDQDYGHFQLLIRTKADALRARDAARSRPAKAKVAPKTAEMAGAVRAAP